MMDNRLARTNGKPPRGIVWVVSLTALVVLPPLAGCGGSDLPDTAPASGVVTLNGKPVEGAMVTFSGTAPKAHPASGTTDASGRFELSTYLTPQVTAQGAVPGDYQVSITKMEKGKVAKGATSADPKAYTPPKSLLPARYANPKKSGLTAAVKEGEANEFTFELTD